MHTDKIRITHQREVILETLKAVKTHPTADELYDMVRRQLPRISLATVYRNLEWMSEQGIVKKIEVGGRQKRFDGNIMPHYHIRCVECGKVDDVECDFLVAANQIPDTINGYRVLGHSMELQGICPDCNLKKVSS